jgi:hypothetical protein
LCKEWALIGLRILGFVFDFWLRVVWVMLANRNFLQDGFEVLVGDGEECERKSFLEWDNKNLGEFSEISECFMSCGEF